MARRKHGFLEDEQGDKSLARVLLLGILSFTLWAVVADSRGAIEVVGAAWALLTSVDLALIGWAAGPRIARYLFPQVGAAVSAVANAASRVGRTDNRLTDDERG